MEFLIKKKEENRNDGTSDSITEFRGFSVEFYPTSVDDSRRTVAMKSGHMIVFDGRIDNKEEIETELEGENLGESELLLEFYLKNGIERFEDVRGAFSFVVIGPEKMILCRDQTGLRPLYFSKDGSLVSNSADWILDRKSNRKDDSVLSSFLVDEKAETESTFYRQLGRVQPGTYVSISDDISSERYWNPVKSDYKDLSFEEAKQKLRQISEEAVRCRSGDCTGVMMSGGFDSTTVASIVKDSCSTELYTYSGVFPSMAAADETQKIDQFVEDIGIHNEKVQGGLEWPLKDLGELKSNLDTGPAIDVNFQLNSKIYFRASWDGANVILTGAGGNMLDGSPLMYSDLLRGKKLRQLVSNISEDQAPAPLILKWFILLPNLPLPDIVKKKFSLGEETGMPAWFKDSEVELEGRENDPEISLHSRKVNYKSHFNYYRDSSLEKIRKNASQHGLKVRHPFLDSRIIELALSLPPEYLFKAGKEKHLFRASFRDLLPDAILNQRKTAVFDELLDKGIFKEEKTQVEQIFEEPEISDKEFIDDEQLQDYLSNRFKRENASLRFWKLLTAEIWLRDDLYKLQE